MIVIVVRARERNRYVQHRDGINVCSGQWFHRETRWRVRTYRTWLVYIYGRRGGEINIFVAARQLNSAAGEGYFLSDVFRSNKHCDATI